MKIDSLLDLGFMLIPIEPNGKRPLIRWSRLLDHKLTPGMIKCLFGKHGNCNVGVLCGEPSNNLVVLDFDKPLAYYKWKRQNEALAMSYTVQTSRGFHVYFRLVDIPKRSFYTDGCDVKVSGYVVGEGSIHPSGVVYHSIYGEQIQEYRNIAELGIEEPVSVVSDNGSQKQGAVRIGSLIETIKAHYPISEFLDRHTILRKSSRDGFFLMGLCPYHDDNDPSLWVNTMWNRCRCFAPHCKAHQHALDVVDAHSLLWYGNTESQSVAMSVADLAAEIGL